MTPFNVIDGQPRAWSLLARSMAARRAASTYLFTGEEGLGQFALALQYAALLNCPQPGERKVETHVLPVPCGHCPACHGIFTLNSEALLIVVPIRSHRTMNEAIDLTNEALEIKRNEPLALLSDASPTTIPIDMARDVKKRLMLQAAPGVHRVALFSQVDKMLQASADALLKLIEEPPANTTIILTAQSPESLLPTIQSRSRRVRLTSVPEPVLVAYLQDRFGQSDEKARLFSRITKGNPGRAIALATADVEEGATPRDIGLTLFRSVITEPSPTVASRIAEMVDDRNRAGAEELIRLWQSLVRDCQLHAGTGETSGLVNVDYANDICRLSRYFADSETAVSMTGHFKKALADLRRNVHIHLLLVALVLRLRACLRAAG